MEPLDVLIVYNEPQLPADHPDAASERGVLDSVTAIERALAARDHKPRRLGLALGPRPLTEVLQRALPCDVAFNLCEGFGGVGQGESQVAGILEMFGVPITGSPSECLALVRHKARTKWLLSGAGLPTPEFCLIGPDQPVERASYVALLGKGPVIVKPAHEDASLGISAESVVTDFGALQRQIERTRERYGPVLIEQFIEGREFNAAVIALPEPTALPLSEIVFQPRNSSDWSIVTYDAKWDVGSQADLRTPPRCPADVAPPLADRIRQIALGAFQVTGCRDYARIDLRVDQQNRIFILEVNGNPDLSPAAGLARAAEAQGIAYDDLVCGIVDQAARRAPDRKKEIRAARVSSIMMDAQDSHCTIRAMHDGDLTRLVEILRACSVFRADEVSVGEEVLKESLRKPSPDDYQVFVAECDGQVTGWSCHGRVPMTDATYDLYWIAVDPPRQKEGIGRKLVERVIESLRGVGARWLLAETSASVQYAPTRRFYERVGFHVLSEIPDFYRVRDGRLIFGRRLDEPGKIES